MIVLVFIVCLRTAPAQCEERRISYLPEVGLTSCMTLAQPELARWMGTHSDLTLARWSCEWADDSDRKV